MLSREIVSGFGHARLSASLRVGFSASLRMTLVLRYRVLGSFHAPGDYLGSGNSFVSILRSITVPARRSTVRKNHGAAIER